MDFKLTDWDLEFLNSLGPIKVKGNIYAPNAQTLNLSQLQECEDIIAHNIQTLDLPQLKECRYLDTLYAQSINLPLLQKCGGIVADNAQTINLPQLQKCGGIVAEKAQTIIIQNHLRSKLKNVPKDCIIKEPSSKVTLEQVYERMLWN